MPEAAGAAAKNGMCHQGGLPSDSIANYSQGSFAFCASVALEKNEPAQ